MCSYAFCVLWLFFYLCDFFQKHVFLLYDCYVTVYICVTFFENILRLLPVFDILVASCFVIRILGGTLFCQTNTILRNIENVFCKQIISSLFVKGMFEQGFCEQNIRQCKVLRHKFSELWRLNCQEFSPKLSPSDQSLPKRVT